MAEIIKFTYGEPVEVALKFAGGRTVQGKYGSQAQYSTVDDQIFWLDAEDASEVDHQLAELGIKPREYFRIVKTKHPRGGGSSFRIQRCQQNGSAPPNGNGTNGNGTNGNGTNGYANGHQSQPDAKLEAQLRASIEMARNAALPPAAPGTAQKMAAAFAVAIDALAEARDYGARKGFKFEFNEEDARCCALSVFINESRK